jgi:ferredoxin
MSERIAIDRIRCDGRGMCADLLPEMIELDDWGYPVVAATEVPPALLPLAQRAVATCPVMALRLVATGARRAASELRRAPATDHLNRTR